MSESFNKLFLEYYNRYQQGGLAVWDQVKIKKSNGKGETLEDYLANKASNLRDIFNNFISKDFKKNLVIISFAKSQNPTQGATSDGAGPDIAVIAAETTWGVYENPMVEIPIKFLDKVNSDGNNLRSVPSTAKRANNDTDKPEKIQTQSPFKFDTNLTTKNTVIPNGRKWDDSKAGGGNTPKKDYTRQSKN